MLNVDLMQLEMAHQSMKIEERKLQLLSGEFDKTMRELDQLISMDELDAVRRKVGRQMDEHLDGIRQMANTALRIRKIYRETERKITDYCDGERPSLQGIIYPIPLLAGVSDLHEEIRQWVGQIETIF